MHMVDDGDGGDDDDNIDITMMMMSYTLIGVYRRNNAT
jgi:hypothetical protein